MQINRLFTITYLLLERGSITASELAERLEVSIRTVYRDIEVLSQAGIPVYSVKGKGGGIRMMPDFVLSKSLLSREEQGEVLGALQALQAVEKPGPDRAALDKLRGLFGTQNPDWVRVDFGGWGNPDKDQFPLIKTAILKRQRLKFTYYASDAGVSSRVVEPLQLWFKGRAWYLHAYCLVRDDYRTFKLTRIKDCVLLPEKSEHGLPAKDSPPRQAAMNKQIVRLKLWVDAGQAYRVYDEFEPEDIERLKDGSFLIRAAYPEDDWVYGLILSFGPAMTVLQPLSVRRVIQAKLSQTLENYQRLPADRANSEDIP